MRYNIILSGLFISFIAFSYSGLFQHNTELLGGTELNGAGCVCHTVERDTSVKVWIEGPETLMVGQTGIYHMYLAGGPAEAGGYNVAGRFGTMVLTDSFSFWDWRTPNELTQAFPLVFPTPQDTIYWEFGYTASDSSSIDTLYSCGLSIVYDGIPDFLDRWNFGPKFPITIIQGNIPVELASFNALTKDKTVELNWITATEINNKGFEIERQAVSEQSATGKWETIGFVPGSGTTTEPKSYSFTDNLSHTLTHTLNLTFTLKYRLKQIDYDGSYKYLNEADVAVDLTPKEFVLYQNYPNPFNPVTTISWQSPVGSHQTLKIFDILGNEVATLVDEYRDVGNYEVTFSTETLGRTSELNSGIYFYQLQVGDISVTKKMIFLK